MVVLLWHFILTSPHAWNVIEHGEAMGGWGDPVFWMFHSPLSVAVFGSAAVLVFFVLSGFVLTLSFEKVDRYRYAPFLIKRVVRIWAPFAVATLVSMAGAILLAGRAVPASEWFLQWSWSEPLGVRTLAHHLGMTGAMVTYNNPMWSLVHELRVSVIFPVIALGAIRAPLATLGVAMVVSVGAVTLSAESQRWSVESLLATLGYVYLFAAGAVIYRLLPALRARLARIPLAGTLAVWAVVVGGLWVCFWIDHTNPNKWVPLPMGVLAIVVVAMTLRGDGVARALSGATAKFLGRISYSLYLIHLPVMLIVMHAWGEGPGLEAARLAAFVLCFPAAWLLNLAVERPAQDFGRWLAAQTAGVRTAAVSAGR